LESASNRSDSGETVQTMKACTASSKPAATLVQNRAVCCFAAAPMRARAFGEDIV
jgi:hypothetical protein